MQYNKNFTLGAVDMRQDGAEDEPLPAQSTYVPPHKRRDAWTFSSGGAVTTAKPSPPAPPVDAPKPPSPPPAPDAPEGKGGASPNMGEEPLPADNTGGGNGGNSGGDDNEGGTSSLMKYLPYAAGAALIYFLFLRKR